MYFFRGQWHRYIFLKKIWILPTGVEPRTFRLLAHKMKLTSKDAFLQLALFTNRFLAAIMSLAFLYKLNQYNSVRINNKFSMCRRHRTKEKSLRPWWVSNLQPFTGLRSLVGYRKLIMGSTPIGYSVFFFVPWLRPAEFFLAREPLWKLLGQATFYVS